MCKAFFFHGLAHRSRIGKNCARFLEYGPCRILFRFRHKFFNLFFPESASHVPYLIVGLSIVDYGQEERGFGFLHFIRTMTSELQVQMNWTAFVFGSISFWVKSFAVVISLPSFGSSFNFYTRTCLSVRGHAYFSPISPHWSVRFSSRALNPKCKESTHQIVR